MVNDVLDTGALRVARLIATTPALAQNIGGPFPQGTYNNSVTYKFRDLVSYLNRTYISKDINPITGILPTVTSSWMNIPIEPDGVLILGDDTPYGISWNASGKAASQDAVYNEIESVKTSVSEKANIISPIFTGDVIVPDQSPNNNSTKVANTKYVDDGLILKANLASPAFTGIPTTPTAPVSTNTTQAASTSFVKSSVLFNSNTQSSALVASGGTDYSTFSISTALGSAVYRFAVIKFKFQTIGNNLPIAIMSIQIRNNTNVVIEVGNLPINNQAYIDNNTTCISKIINDTFTGTYTFSLWTAFTSASAANYPVFNLTAEVLFFA